MQRKIPRTYRLSRDVVEQLESLFAESNIARTTILEEGVRLCVTNYRALGDFHLRTTFGAYDLFICDIAQRLGRERDEILVNSLLLYEKIFSTDAREQYSGFFNTEDTRKMQKTVGSQVLETILETHDCRPEFSERELRINEFIGKLSEKLGMLPTTLCMKSIVLYDNISQNPAQRTQYAEYF